MYNDREFDSRANVKTLLLKIRKLILPFCNWVRFFLQDTFFYSLVYDPTQKTLLADKGEIRVGPRFQADVPEMLQEGQLELHNLTNYFYRVLLFTSVWKARFSYLASLSISLLCV